jgi:hypothetical protein
MRMENAELDRRSKASYRFAMKIRRIRYLICARVHRDAEETFDETTNERILGNETGNLEIVLLSGMGNATFLKAMSRQTVMMAPDKIRDAFGRESGAAAVKSLTGNIGNARKVLREQLRDLVGAVPKVE